MTYFTWKTKKKGDSKQLSKTNDLFISLVSLLYFLASMEILASNRS